MEKSEKKLFRVPFKKIVYGWGEVYAKDINDPAILDGGEWIDEVDNKSEYFYDENNIEEIKR